MKKEGACSCLMNELYVLYFSITVKKMFISVFKLCGSGAHYNQTKTVQWRLNMLTVSLKKSVVLELFKRRKFLKKIPYRMVCTTHLWGRFFSVLDISTAVRIVSVPSKGSVGIISPRAFRGRVVRYWHPLVCRAISSLESRTRGVWCTPSCTAGCCPSRITGANWIVPVVHVFFAWVN